MSGLRLENISKKFGNFEVIKNVNLDIKDGEFVVFVGPSGCGKSTLLRIISGLEETTAGEIFIDESNVTEHEPSDRGVAMVFQSYALYPHMNVEKNLGFGLRMGGMPKDEVAERVQEAARILDIDSLMHRKPKALSGGQRQRVAIGRAIVRQPKIFLFDEPLSNLDAELRTQTRLEITRLHQDLSATMIFVTHDQVEAMTLADKIVVLRDGKIEQQGAPITLYDDPDNTFVAGFIGSPKMNLLQATVTEVREQHARVRVDGFGKPELSVEIRDSNNAKVGDEVTFGIRPVHFIEVSVTSVNFEANVQVVERLGGVSFIHSLDTNNASLVVQAQGHSTLPVGESAVFGVDETCCLLFAEDGSRL